MASYSSQFKEQAVRRLMPPNSQSIPMVSRELSVTVSTLRAILAIEVKSSGYHHRR